MEPAYGDGHERAIIVFMMELQVVSGIADKAGLALDLSAPQIAVSVRSGILLDAVLRSYHGSASILPLVGCKAYFAGTFRPWMRVFS
jgi:hypothetical protein